MMEVGLIGVARMTRPLLPRIREEVYMQYASCLVGIVAKAKQQRGCNGEYQVGNLEEDSNIILS